MNVFLIGYRGTGKTTVARLLAERLHLAWIDADDELERRAGKSIAQIFSAGGEPAFRDLESQVVSDLAARDGLVIALGGGAVLRDENRRTLLGRGPIIWLQASVETISRRLAADASTAARRPNLTAAGGAAEIEKLLSERTPLYLSCADISIDTEHRAPDEIADQIEAWLVGRTGAATKA